MSDQTYMNRVMESGIVDCWDGAPAKIEVCASVGEFDGAILSVMAKGAEMLELNVVAIDDLIEALQSARGIVARHIATIRSEQ